MAFAVSDIALYMVGVALLIGFFGGWHFLEWRERREVARRWKPPR